MTAVAQQGFDAIEAIGHFVDGRVVPGRAGRHGDVFDPATGRVTGRVAMADAAEADAVVRCAAAAQRHWADVPLARRAELMFALRNAVLARRGELAARITAEQGKTTADAVGEVNRGIEVLEFACGVPQLLKGAFSEQVAGGVDVHSVLQPLGVVAAITPFNFPVMVPLWMLAGAIACGNAVVLKPSEKDPGATLLLAQLLCEAGLPPGVVNVLQGDRVAVDALLCHPLVDAVSFVGSTPVARHVFEAGSAAGKRVQALGGAKNHMVVLPDADVEVAADAAVGAAFGAAGERCMAISVLVAIGDVTEPLLAAIEARMRRLRVGPGAEPASDIGPLISAGHRDRVAGYVARAQAEGAELRIDGRLGVPERGFFLGPSLVDRVTPAMALYRDEIFGPVLSVVRCTDLDAALALVNSSPYGNGAALFTRDGGAARRFQREARIGMIGINVPIPVPAAHFSFGGWKASLFGDTHIYGPDGIRFFTRSKVVTTRWPDAAPGRVELGMPTDR
jgi:malonate-semialdehyde dehydrogenase (acetylating)/methylmalonate-semialdehyde dehydrogenase